MPTFAWVFLRVAGSTACPLLDKNEPSLFLRCTDTCFMRSGKPHEQIGQAKQVVFMKGLARFKSTWFLYYGTADSKVAGATRPVE